MTVFMVVVAFALVLGVGDATEVKNCEISIEAEVKQNNFLISI